ncbi:MAG: mechanosensitive ion channel family protein [Treponema sp.]|nr:mechanosensitive ion channel family protein [Treponema sp.]
MDEQTDIFTESVNTATKLFKDQSLNFINFIKSFMTWENMFKIIGAIAFIFITWIIYKILIRSVKKIPAGKINDQGYMLLSRGIKYGFYTIIAMYVLNFFGVKLSAIWGAAGIAGIALGFAAQTSVSNLISGLFVLTEGSVHVGDTIIVDGITGVVDAVNLLSVRIHTYDNQMVRIPNSTIINSNLINNSFHDKRRLTMDIYLEFDTDLRLALETVITAVNRCPTVLSDPAPAAWISSFGESGVIITAGIWFKPENFRQTRTDFYINILEEFTEAGIKIPYSKMDITILNNEKNNNLNNVTKKEGFADANVLNN